MIGQTQCCQGEPSTRSCMPRFRALTILDARWRRTLHKLIHRLIEELARALAIMIIKVMIVVI